MHKRRKWPTIVLGVPTFVVARHYDVRGVQCSQPQALEDYQVTRVLRVHGDTSASAVGSGPWRVIPALLFSWAKCFSVLYRSETPVQRSAGNSETQDCNTHGHRPGTYRVATCLLLQLSHTAVVSLAFRLVEFS